MRRPKNFAIFCHGLTVRGLPPTVADITLGLYRANRAGKFATVDPMLESLLGHPPISLRDLIAKKIIE